MASSVYDDNYPTAQNVGGNAGKVDCKALDTEDIVPNKHICFQTLNQVQLKLDARVDLLALPVKAQNIESDQNKLF